MKNTLSNKLKAKYLSFIESKSKNEILELLNQDSLNGNNQKYMKMYDWMSYGYDIAENVIGKLKYGNAVEKLRAEILSQLEWKEHCSVLCVSIGTGKDIEFIPKKINKDTLDIVGIDISMGMLKKCRNKYKGKLEIPLVQCSAEDLPFNDEQFDIVFHVGGINFFNDPGLAIREMIRVAKKGTKILIADETGDFIESQYKKSQFSKKYFNETTFDLQAITSNIPVNVNDKNVQLLWDNKFYCITFRKQF